MQYPFRTRRSVNSYGAPTDTAQRATRGVFREALLIVAYALACYIIISALIGRYEIEQTSMEPNFHPGQRVVVNKIDQALSGWMGAPARAGGAPGSSFDLRRGQVVVFYDTDARVDPPLIKRLVGLPGETILIGEGGVFVDGRRLDEAYLGGASTACSVVCGPLTLGPDEYFFLGDNRSVSRDSRDFGPVPASQVVGPVVARVWPLEDAQIFP